MNRSPQILSARREQRLGRPQPTTRRRQMPSALTGISAT